ncbi:bacteriocin biosynthesis cyclodehydratase domain-containing protein [Cryobacterium psychrotolerans]|uniref:Bacteriocin biosynthesis cyclodehydratase domain-containing protein n=1 Tax=Cryobacterium psychrotolerans TaxID=386301 RepID=A0A1G9EYZ2_9MICO|nr:TOMM precursor leader peptide-binding protein [Cryobacterium sp. TMT1-2-1]TFD83304.1 TOMM precursor leader peptide-binding protein [Cryobacterium psychrotolerans]SDK81215.1 bacteriocin biosynthesis cyclodehydratase domain-containing protein [Cryobacterium psychrotolerans]
MVIRLNPRYPLVWRSPDTIQFGVDRALLVLPGITRAEEHVLAALRGGVPQDGAVMLGSRAGASPADTAAFLRRLRPVLETTVPATAAPGPRALPAPAATAPGPRAPTVHGTVCVDGSGPTADRIRGLLGDLGIPTRLTDADPALAIVVGHYVLEPARHRRWLRRDIPHLPVVFSDGEVRVGPLVEPGSGPCLYCLELDRVDADRAWPAMASQLLGREAPTESARASIDVAARVAGLVQDRLAGGRSELWSASLALDAQTGEVRRREHRPHERCGCRSLPGNVTVLAGIAAAVPMPPSSAPAAAVPA